MTSKGQVTVPKEIRERLDLGPGSMVRFSVDESGQVVISRAGVSLQKGYGAVRPIRQPEEFQALRDEAIDEHVGRRFLGAPE